MTRGQIAIIHKGFKGDTRVMTSIEFNGDMYIKNGHGPEVIKLLKRVNDVADYQYIVAKFNCDNHHYNDCETLTYEVKDQKALDVLDFTKDYFDNWFSDYVYLKNITKENYELKTEVYDKRGKSVKTITTTIKPNTIVVLCFGSVEKIIEPPTEE